HSLSPVLKPGPISQSRYLALAILVRVERDRAFADIALEHALERAKLDPRDAALCTEIVFGTLRWRRHLDWRLGPHLRRALDKLDPWVRALLRLTAYQVLFLDRVPRWAAVDEAVSLARLKSRTPGPAEFINAVLRSLTRTPGPPPLPASAVEALGVRLSFPDWIAARWLARYGAREAEALMVALNLRPPIAIRANTLRITREALAARLRDEELAETRPTPLAPEGLVVERGHPARWAAFTQGWCAVQDEASMLVARLLDPQPGEHVVDACAAPGTKATHLAQLMQNRGKIVALDPQAARLKLLAKAAGRLGVGIIEAHAGPVEKLAPRWRGRADRVLVDAPCSNLGVLRRNPEVKWRRTEQDLGRLAAKQHAILEAAAAMVRPGGRLVYATCSLEPEENDEVVRAFLGANADWRVDLPAGFPVPPDAAGFIRCLPHVHGTDGFTAVRLIRAASPGGR
ncbi:MAG TPA: 16S rRNA (cytosine(967)-C(5))-methyltransferase RsmB, partial [Methylomirabilota bacterium]|nr:16S rRNA (cytosine(967)-C(5))-methyltransferase RsmB [Methylomirabilota bacterium]